MAKKYLEERKPITGCIDIYDFEGNITSIIKRLEDYRREYGSTLEIEIVVEGYDSYTDVSGTVIRVETDTERDHRLDRARKDRLSKKVREGAQKEKDLKELKRLQKKYSKGV